MKPQRKSVCLIAGGIVEENLRLQPWRYLSEVGLGLAAQGHEVTIISDNSLSESEFQLLAGVSIIYLPSVRNPLWRNNDLLQKALARLAPDVILWHLGLISFLHYRLEAPPDTPIIGIFTSPLYHPGDLTHLGINKLVSGYQITALHFLGSLVPRWLFRYFIVKNNLRSLVVQTETTRRQLVEQELWSGDIQVIPPGVDEIWRQLRGTNPMEFRMVMGYKPDDNVIVYFGSPAPVRGLPTLVEAFAIARGSDSSLKLLILNRRKPCELRRANAALLRLISECQFSKDIHIIDSFLDIDELVGYVNAADIVALPFELVPSDAPLSVLEAGALGKPVVTTRVACLPELVSPETLYLADVSDPESLAQALLDASINVCHKEVISRHSATRTWREVAAEWSPLVKYV